jgi:polyphosphate kinase
MSENIRVRSILGRYLEHSRIFYFENATGKRPRLYAGSADWMARNFYRRIEVVFPVEDEAIRNRILDSVLPTYMKDCHNATQLRSNGSYRKIVPKGTDFAFSSQRAFIEEAIQASKREEIAPDEEE